MTARVLSRGRQRRHSAWRQWRALTVGSLTNFHRIFSESTQRHPTVPHLTYQTQPPPSCLSRSSQPQRRSQGGRGKEGGRGAAGRVSSGRGGAGQAGPTGEADAGGAVAAGHCLEEARRARQLVARRAGGVGGVGGHAKSGAEISNDLKQGERRPRNVSVWITMGKKENLP